jgi:LAO/AO transport system ATPase/phenylacetic acid degradation protein PaaD
VTDLADAPAAHPLLPGILAGQRQVLARAISAVERAAPGVAALQAALVPHLGRAHVLGLTGSPGAGKSTLVHALLGELLRRGQKVAVVAVDPSSPITGGAVLGDRVRMGEHGAHSDVFIRSVASRGHLGGLSPTTRSIVDLFDAAGFHSVIVETVGAGQSEVEIMNLADTRIVACPPGLGDEVQAIKAGILEIADVLAVTKADLPLATVTASDLRDMLHLRRAGAPGTWKVPVIPTSATQGSGVGDLVEAALAHAAACGRGRRLQAISTPEGERVRRLAAADPWVRRTGIRCTAAAAGSAEVRLTLTDEHLNFNRSCHGGVIFTLADTAFGLASNSRGVVAAGIDAHITYQLPARAGDTLIARAHEVSRSRRLSVVRVDVTHEDGRSISSFTGTVFITEQRHD